MLKFFKKKEAKMPEFVMMNCVKSCGKEKCPIWVVNYSPGKDGKPVGDGRCGFAWLPIILIEIRQSIDKLREEKNGSQE